MFESFLKSVGSLVGLLTGTLAIVAGVIIYFFTSQERQDRDFNEKIDKLEDKVYDDLHTISIKVETSMDCVKKDVIVANKKAERVDERLNHGGKQIDTISGILSETTKGVTVLSTRVDNLENQNREIVKIQHEQSKILSSIQQDVASTNATVGHIKSMIENMNKRS